MDAVKFIRERERMCDENSSCNQMATRDAGADVTEAALLTRQYLIATMIASMHGKNRDTTEDDDG